MKYDDASWHYGGQFPADLPMEAGATHIGMFVAWCLQNGLAGALHTHDFPLQLESLRSRSMTPGAWFIQACDGKLTDEDLNVEGNVFTSVYYAADNPRYMLDYEATLCRDLASAYHVPDTWGTYDALAPVISVGFLAWKQRQP